MFSLIVLLRSLALLLLSSLVLSLFLNREFGVLKEQKRVAEDNAVVGKGEYRSEQMAKLKEYAEAKVAISDQEFIGFGDRSLGVWKPDAENTHGLEFGMMLAVNYLRYCPEKIRLARLLTHPTELKGVDFVISPWEECDLESYGFQEVASENFVYVYQRKEEKQEKLEKQGPMDAE